MKNSLVKLSSELKDASKIAKCNAPTLLTVAGVGGFISTVFMAIKATPKAMAEMDRVEKELPDDTSKPKKIFEKTKVVLPIYLPTIIMGGSSIACVIGANNISTSRLAAATTACELSEKAFNEYKTAVIEKIGEKKENEVRDEIAKKHVAESVYDDDDEALQPITGTQLFMDSLSGQYFRSTKDDIYRALMDFQRWLMLEDFATVNEWYSHIPTEDLKQIRIGDRLGFNSTQGLDIYWSVQMAPNGEPVTVLEYRTPPTYDFAILS